MIRALLLIVLWPAALAAQSTYVGVRGGRTTARLPRERTRSGPVAGAFAQVDLTEHLGVGWGVSWRRSAAEDYVDPWLSVEAPVVETESVVTDVVGRLSAARAFDLPFPLTWGVAASAGGWLGLRTAGTVAAPDTRRFDFGHLLVVSVFAARDRARIELAAWAYHGERGLWSGGPRRRESTVVLGLAYRIR